MLERRRQSHLRVSHDFTCRHFNPTVDYGFLQAHSPQDFQTGTLAGVWTRSIENAQVRFRANVNPRICPVCSLVTTTPSPAIDGFFKQSNPLPIQVAPFALPEHSGHA
jgi:hypothetical protein